MSRRDYRTGTDVHLPPRATCKGSLHMACTIARRFHAEIPTVEQLRAAVGMSRATAYRWIHALKATRPEPQP